MLSLSVSDFNSVSKCGIDKYFGSGGQSKLSDCQEKTSAVEKSEPAGEAPTGSKDPCDRLSEQSSGTQSHLKRPGSANLPKGWDPEVFER